MRKRSKKKQIIAAVIVIALIAALVLSLVIGALSAKAAEDDPAADASAQSSSADTSAESAETAGITASAARYDVNVYVDDTVVTGMTEKEIGSLIADKIRERKEDPITLYVRGTPIRVTAGDMGLSCTNVYIADEAAKVGQRGNIWQRFQAQQYTKDYGGIVFDLQYTFDYETIYNLITNLCTPCNIPTVDAVITQNSDGTFSATEKVDGMAVNVEESALNLTNYMNNVWVGGEGAIQIVCDTVTANGDPEQLALIQSVLGVGTTSFDSSFTERSANIAVGTEKINGTYLYPGQSQSVVALLTPFTAENGYLPAGTFEEGMTVDSFGGGVCQIATTLYRAILEAELQVDMRCEHSMVVGYVEPSMDAAIAEGIKDLVFTNNTDAPIYIQGYTTENTVTFAIFGHETRDPARTLAFEGEVLTKEDLSEKVSYYLVDSDEVGDITCIDAHPGMTAQAWKIIYINGVEDSRVRVNYSHYYASEGYYEIGIGGATQEELAALSEAVASGSLIKIYQVIDYINSYRHPDRGSALEAATQAAMAAEAAAAAAEGQP